MSTFNTPVNRNVFRKDAFDRWKLKREKAKFHASPESKEKVVTVIKITN